LPNSDALTGLAAGALLMLAIGSLPIAIRWGKVGPLGLRALDVWPLATAVFFGATTLVSVLAGSPSLRSAQAAIGSRYLASGLVWLSGFVAVAAVIAILSRRERRMPVVPLLETCVARVTAGSAVALAIGVWSVRVIVAVRYGIHYSGSATADRIEDLPYGMSILQSLTNTVGLFVPVWAYIVLRSRRGPRLRALCALLLCGELVSAFMSGRRELVFLLFLLLFIELSRSHRKRIRAAILVAMGIALIWVAFPRFEAARYAASATVDPGQQDLIEFLSGTARPSLDSPSSLRESLADRSATYVVWAAEVVQAQRTHSFLNGSVLVKGILFTVPSALIPEKRGWRSGDTYINEEMGIDRGDSPDSIAMTGLADFGPAGVLVYSLAFGGLIILGERIATLWRNRSAFLACVVMLATVRGAALVERTIVGLAVDVRNILILAVVTWLLGFVLEKPRGDRSRVRRRGSQFMIPV